MFRAVTPIDILQSHATTLAGTLPGLYDGDVESVHDARVASRRIRQVLPLTNQWHRANTIDDMTEKFREIGRALGRVRDADARLDMLRSLESRIPPAAPSLVVLRRHHDRLRQRLMRKLIKSFERLEVPNVLHHVKEGATRAHRYWRARWQEQLRRVVKERAHATCESVHHTTGVYFPNRLHGTRISVKKTRYAVEIAGETRVGPAVDDVLRFLKNTQDVLGDLRDRQILVDELSAMKAPAPAEIDPGQIGLVIQIVEAEIRELHAKYLKRRPRLLEICERLDSVYSLRRVPIAAVTSVTTGVMVSSAVYLLRRRTRVAARHPEALPPARPEPEVSVRIPIPGTAIAGR